MRLKPRHAARHRNAARCIAESLETRMLLSSAPPFVEAINRSSPSGAVTDATSVTYTVTFNEPVVGVDASDFQVTTSGSTAASTPVMVTPLSGASYLVTVNGIHGNGTLGLNLVDDGTIHDAAGNKLTSPDGALSFEPAKTIAAGTSPYYVVIADVNGDGKPDVVVANEFDSTVSVLLGNGDGSFQPARNFSSLYESRTLAVADVNGDGKPDIILPEIGGDPSMPASQFGVLCILSGNGDGTFKQPYTVVAGPQPFAISVADLNGDGRPDVFLTSYANNSLDVMLGNGNGTFKTPRTFTAGRSTMSIATADLNGDGKVDVVVGHISNNYSATVFLGDGSGGFQSQSTVTVGPTGPFNLTLADVNGDGHPDLLVANSGERKVSVLLGNGDGTFDSPRAFSVATIPSFIAVADMNSDGKPDLVVADFEDTFFNIGTVGILNGNGDGTFAPQRNFATSTAPFSSPRCVAVADLNGDGRADIVVANAGGIMGMTGIVNDNVGVLLADNGIGSFTGPVYTIDQAYPRVVSIDRASSTSVRGSHAIYAVTFNEPVFGVSASDFDIVTTGAVTVSKSLVVMPQSASVYLVRVTGIKGIGTIELTFANRSEIHDAAGNPLIASQGPQFGTLSTFATGDFSKSVLAADLNGDGKADLITFDPARVNIFLTNADGLQQRQTYAADNSPRSVAVADVNGDGTPDLLVLTGSGVNIFLGNGDGTFNAAGIVPAGGGTVSLAVADINNDGLPDLVTTNYFQTGVFGEFHGAVSVMLGEGGGRFSLPLTSSLEFSQPYSQLTTSDVNGDGKPDLIVSTTDQTISLLLGNGDGTFQARRTFSVAGSFITPIPADLNRDGKPDIVLASRGNAVGVLLGNGDGTYLPEQTFAVGQTLYAAVVADLNGDGNPDVVAATPDGTVLLPGNGDGTFGAAETIDPGSFVDSVAVGDVNGDGRPDIAEINSPSDVLRILPGQSDVTFNAPVYQVGHSGKRR